MFGNWKNALACANLDTTHLNRPVWTEEDIDTELSRLERELGHKPHWSEIKRLSNIHPDTIERRRGGLAKNSECKPILPEWNIDDVPPEDGAWVAGFFEGEGSFIINKHGNATVCVGQRADGIELLHFIENTLGLPSTVKVYSNEYRRARGAKCGDEARLSIGNRYVIRDRILPFFDRFQLRGRKALEYKVFKEVILFLCERLNRGMYHRRYTPAENTFLTESTERLRHIRYDPTSSSKGKAPTTPS